MSDAGGSLLTSGLAGLGFSSCAAVAAEVGPPRGSRRTFGAPHHEATGVLRQAAECPTRGEACSRPGSLASAFRPARPSLRRWDRLVVRDAPSVLLTMRLP